MSHLRDLQWISGSFQIVHNQSTEISLKHFHLPSWKAALNVILCHIDTYCSQRERHLCLDMLVLFIRILMRFKTHKHPKITLMTPDAGPSQSGPSVECGQHLPLLHGSHTHTHTAGCLPSEQRSQITDQGLMLHGGRLCL